MRVASKTKNAFSQLRNKAAGGDVGAVQRLRWHVRRRLEKNLAGFRRLAKFSPHVAGEAFTMADCSAYVSLPLTSMATRLVYGEDLLAAAGIDWKPYSKLVGERPSAQRVVADRKAEPDRSAGGH